MTAPTDRQIEMAILWLDCNEGEDGPEGERSACVAVMLYLEGLLERRQAREAGIAPSYLRRLKAGTI
jgi:hypothetical protein